MRKTIALLCAIMMLLLTACNSTSVTETTPPTETTTQIETTTPADGGEDTPEVKEPIDTMEKLTRVDGVLSVTQLAFSNPTPDAVAYKLLYETENGKLHADVVLPADYIDPNRQYTVLLYFPDVNIGIDNLASNYVKNDIIVVRPYRRGSGESEGVRDFGGPKDLFDAQALLRIIDSATFIQYSNLYVAGAMEYSVLALRLLAEDNTHRISGCAAVNPITDVSTFAASRENIQALVASLIGKTYDEAPEEYALRSAVNFASKLDRPILLLYYTQNMVVPQEQAAGLYNLLTNKTRCTYQELEGRYSDFSDVTANQWLFSWINQQNKNPQSLKIEEDNKNYIVRTEWMTFYFSKREYQRAKILDIVTEAVSVMADIRAYLGVNYTLQDAAGAKCYFDSTAEFNGEPMSYFDSAQGIMMCQSVNSLVHEYVHMVSMSSADYLYYPQGYFVEGLASFVALNYFDNIASQTYQYFYVTGFRQNADQTIHQMICDLLKENQMDVNVQKNYRRAHVALQHKNNDISKEDHNSIFYQYDVGFVFVDYCIKQLGGVNKFMTIFGDSVRFENAYGKSADEILNEALAYNMSLFYPHN